MVEVNQHTIRNFKIGDRELVLEFFNQMSGETRAFFNRGEGNQNDALSYFAKNGDEPDRVRFLSSVMDENGKEIMTGYVFAWDMGTCVPILGIAVREEYKGIGLGRVLMQHLIDYLKDKNYGGVMLTTAMANVRGQALYTRTGFEHIGTHTSGEMLYILRFKK